MQRGHQSVGTHNDRSFRQLIVALADRFEVVSGRVCLTNSARRQVHDLVAVVADVGVELGNTQMRPVTTDGGKDVSKSVRSNVSSVWFDSLLGDGSVNVGNDNVV